MDNFRSKKKVKVLLIEDNPDHVLLIKEKCNAITRGTIDLCEANCIKKGLAIIADKQIEIVLLDLCLPDSKGIETVMHFKDYLEKIPFIILTSLDDEIIELDTIKEGIQDYLVKGEFDHKLLWRSINYAIERHKLLKILREHAIYDQLTGLYNRRGFFNFLDQQVKLSNRNKNEFFLVFADLDGLKLVNDTMGHTVGDDALVCASNILKEVFRESDTIARIGGDEFAIIITGSKEIGNIKSIGNRLEDAVNNLNEEAENPFKLSISIGISKYDPIHPITEDKLIAKADKKMYYMKKQRKKRK